MILMVVKNNHDVRYVQQDKHGTFKSYKRCVLSTCLKELITVKTDNPELEISLSRYFRLSK
jgi:hypothetical protein